MHLIRKHPMRYSAGLLLLMLIFAACSTPKKMDVGEEYYINYNKKNPTVEVYRSSIDDKKFDGVVTRRTTGLYDTTLLFTLVGSFKKGILNGPDSTFRNDTLIEIENYARGVKQGDQIKFSDSVKVVSPYADGVIHGFQSTYVHDQLEKKAYFNRGVKDSVECFYDSLGQVVTTFEYYFHKSDYWESHLDLDEHDLVSLSFGSYPDTLTMEYLSRAEYRGTITYYSYDPNGIGNASPWDVVHESIVENEFDPSFFGYFYVIDENTCQVCDYIDDKGIWVAYSNGFELWYYWLWQK